MRRCLAAGAQAGHANPATADPRFLKSRAAHQGAMAAESAFGRKNRPARYFAVAPACSCAAGVAPCNYEARVLCASARCSQVRVSLNIPILGLFDSDAHGLKILSVYMQVLGI